MTATHSDPLWTRAFVLLFIVQFLGYAQHFVLQPTIPIYVTQLGASPFVVGLVMASFAATSMVLRPLTIEILFTTKGTKEELMMQRFIYSHHPISELRVFRALRGEYLIRIRTR